ncbi:hypothetical protein HN51_009981 [Arachis hypogaea]
MIKDAFKQINKKRSIHDIIIKRYIQSNLKFDDDKLKVPLCRLSYLQSLGELRRNKIFLLVLQKLGKGDWRGIAKNYVISRTPTQVVSHAQKYFIRQNNVFRRKRRSSLFEIVADEDYYP